MLYGEVYRFNGIQHKIYGYEKQNFNNMQNETSNLAETEALNKTHVTSSATDNNWRKCKHCGKFISYRQMEEYKDVMFHFIPDSEITTEEAYWVHRHC